MHYHADVTRFGVLDNVIGANVSDSMPRPIRIAAHVELGG